jgi:hypothetical protein
MVSGEGAGVRSLLIQYLKYQAISGLLIIEFLGFNFMESRRA